MEPLDTVLTEYQRKVEELQGQVAALELLLEQERSRAPFCSHGHKLTFENTYIAPKTGFRGCKICRRTQTLKSQKRRRAKMKETRTNVSQL